MDSTFPAVIETSRLILRPYREGDESWYFEMSQRNHVHLEKYESENPAMAIKTEKDARELILDLIKSWKTGTHFFMGVSLKESDQFVAQLYIGLVNRDLPEFGIGYFVDVEHEGFEQLLKT